MTGDSLEPLARRVREGLSGTPITQKRMFGGVSFFLNGNMLCTVFDEGLMLRVGREAEAEALARPCVRPPSKTRKMSGFVFVEREGLVEDAALCSWLQTARAHVEGLPAKA
jgi:TfoX/Sxy family transcriptional regulator of competence genes